MGYRELSHTSDTGLEIWAASLAELFGAAALGFADTVADLSAIEPRERGKLACSASGRDLLMVAWLEELLYEFEVAGRLYSEVRADIRQTDADWRLEAAVRGEPYDAGRHGLKVPIKGVTYHGLEVFEDGRVWRGRVLFDI